MFGDSKELESNLAWPKVVEENVRNIFSERQKRLVQSHITYSGTDLRNASLNASASAHAS